MRTLGRKRTECREKGIVVSDVTEHRESDSGDQSRRVAGQRDKRDRVAAAAHLAASRLVEGHVADPCGATKFSGVAQCHEVLSQTLSSSGYARQHGAQGDTQRVGRLLMR